MLLQDLVIVFTLCVGVVIVFHRLRLPPTVGFLLTGLLAGPHALEFVGSPAQVEALAEVGVVVLLFTVGVEFSLSEILRLRRLFLMAGGGQVLLCTLAGTLAGVLFGLPWSQSVFLGFLLALSSTAVVLKLLIDRGETASPHGKVATAVLIFQDLAVVPMLLALPLLAGKADGGPVAAVVMVGKSLGIVVGILFLARVLVPWLLERVVRTKSRELFVMSVLAVLLGTAELTHVAGLSLALGAFLAGLVISESPYSHHALGEVLPFRDALASVFFVSVGMLFDIGLLLEDPAGLLGLLAFAIAVKAGLCALVVKLRGYPWPMALRTGLLIGQVGEFSFVLLQLGKGEGLMPERLESRILATAVLSMALTPLLEWLGRRLATRGEAADAKGEAHEGGRDHVIVVGYGLAGRNQVHALQHAGIPFEVLEMNPEVVSQEAAGGLPIRFGDSTRASTLEEVDVRRARLLVIAISDPSAAERTIRVARRLNPSLHIVVRARFLAERERLIELGADEVVPEDLETSIEIFTRTLSYYFVPRDEVEELVRRTRSSGYGVIGDSRDPGREPCPRTLLPGLALDLFRVEEGSRLAGRLLGGSGFKEATGLLIAAAVDGDRRIDGPGPELELRPGMVAVVLGAPDRLRKAAEWFLRRAEDERGGEAGAGPAPDAATDVDAVPAPHESPERAEARGDDGA
ncbi:MAG: cation:proton antiporter [Planctomycetota bacterium]